MDSSSKMSCRCWCVSSRLCSSGSGSCHCSKRVARRLRLTRPFGRFGKDGPRRQALATRYTVKSGLLHEKVTSDLWCREAPLEGC
jgi:hypothetical protein